MLTAPLEVPSLEEIARRAAERHSAAKACVSQPGRFIGVSLGEWLSRVRLAGVPIVPAERIAQMPRETWMRWEEELPSDEPFWRALRVTCDGAPSGHVLRWDACSGVGLKWAMSHFGQADEDDRRRLSLDDPRACDILYEYPSDSIAIWSRPWVDALRIDGYPVEFRVFVRDSRVLGVASYYPQRALPDVPEVRAWAEQCVTAAQNVVVALIAMDEYPWMPSYEGRFTPGLVSATMDFLVTQDGEVQFLEAGPPFGAGAHPCAFLDREIDGVALALAPGVRLR